MTEQPMRLNKEIRRTCAQKIRSVEIGSLFLAILGSLMEEDWTTPNVMELRFARDTRLWGRSTDAVKFKAFGLRKTDLIRNIHGLAGIAQLDGDEVGYLLGMVAGIKGMG